MTESIIISILITLIIFYPIFRDWNRMRVASSIYVRSIRLTHEKVIKDYKRFCENKGIEPIVNPSTLDIQNHYLKYKEYLGNVK